jgi:putative ABC transport system permease protein
VLPLILTNLTRRKARALATAAGIAIGVGTIVALLSIGSGVKQTASGLARLGNADFGVFQSDVGDPTASLLPVSLVGEFEQRSDVADATPLMLIIGAVKQDAGAVVFGAEPDGFVWKRLVIVRGRRATGPDQTMIGQGFADSQGLGPGDRLRIKNRPFTIAGVYHTGIFFEDHGAFVDLSTAQALTSHPMEATTIVVQLEPNVTNDAAAKALRAAFPGVQIIGTADEATRLGANGQLIGKTVTLIAVLALIVGGLGVTNTMAMAVMERRRELALLASIGWRRLRIATLVLGEGVAVSLIGAAMGLLLGVVGADLLIRALGVTAIVSPKITAWGLGRGLLIGVAIGVLGGLYPAWRGTALSGSELLGR